MDWNLIMSNVYPVIAMAINTVGVLIIVQFIKVRIRIVHDKVPYLLPILAGMLGPAVALAQNFLSEMLGVPIDLSPLIAVATGGSSVAAFQARHQFKKMDLDKMGH